MSTSISSQGLYSLSKKQKELVTGDDARTKTGYRRIKGPAGSGKSLVLAARAAQLATEKKDVLVVTFNITLRNYLKSLAIRYLKNLEDQPPDVETLIAEQITWYHFHGWCKSMCKEAGLENEYQNVWKKPVDIANLVNEALDSLLDDRRPIGLRPTYDAILVDEGQDFNIDWWHALQRVRRSENSKSSEMPSEMLLVADKTQDLYNRAKYWTDKSMKGAGFVGAWKGLDISYRMPPKLIKYLQQYAEKYLPKDSKESENPSIDLPEPESDELDKWPVEMIWRQVSEYSTREEKASISVQAVQDMMEKGIAYSDITLLVSGHEMGLECVEMLAEKHVETTHVFGKDWRESRKNKNKFNPGDNGKLKSSTIHSFKGWESSCMVININHADAPEDMAAIYVALSRLKRREQGSYLTVICSTPELKEFGETWPIYELRDDR
ncbi:MAG: hypothetical protein GDA48_21755 [Hormoscilla sp. GM102CHS1]|nr:hypothetical protein [Hormoscilla sp. GM102CHS1]